MILLLLFKKMTGFTMMDVGMFPMLYVGPTSI